jgi:hypothetical protein
MRRYVESISLQYLSSITTANSTIEDAERAIYAEGFTSLSISKTTFNRNRIGIELNTPFPSMWVPGPIVWIFSGNRFTCDAPLNGTTNGITEVGVRLRNSFLYTFQSSVNRFSDLQFGIFADGVASAIGVNGLVMDRIRRDGVFMEHGTLNIKRSFFYKLCRKQHQYYQCQNS